MRYIKLDNHKGLPMYFLKERISGLDYKINFSDTLLSEVGDELELGDFIFRVDEIRARRPSPLNYGVTETIMFHLTTSRLVRKIERGANGTRNEVNVIQ